MTRLVIADHDGSINLPDRISPGDTLHIEATVRVYRVERPDVDVSSFGRSMWLKGDLEIESISVAVTGTIA